LTIKLLICKGEKQFCQTLSPNGFKTPKKMLHRSSLNHNRFIHNHNLAKRSLYLIIRNFILGADKTLTSHNNTQIEAGNSKKTCVNLFFVKTRGVNAPIMDTEQARYIIICEKRSKEG
jgi:tRNA(Leu) C34 or U34 (ribose-2'-O)-methylase TrmL